MGFKGTFHKRQDEEKILSYAPMQESAAAADVTYADGVYSVADKAGRPTLAKGVRVSKTSAGGNLEVHLVDDPAGEYEVYDLEAGDKEGFLFDQVIEANTTIPVADIKILI